MADGVHGGDVYRWAGRFKVSELLDFSANINPWGPPDAVMRAIVDALPMVSHYPDPRQRTVKDVLARRFSVEPSHIWCGNGVCELIDAAIRAWHPRRVVILEPAFAEYRLAAARSRIPVVAISLWRTQHRRKGPALWQLPVETLDRVLQAQDLLFINNPHNPTGAVFSIEEWMAAACTWTGRGVRIVVDESFMDFLPDERGVSLIPRAAVDPGFCVLRSATKFYALPGLRFGAAISRAPEFAAWETVRDGWSVNQLAQMAASAAYQDAAYALGTRRWLEDARRQAAELWSDWAGAQWHPGAANFFCLEFNEANIASGLVPHLERKGILVRSLGDFKGLDARWWRVALRRPAENAALYREADRYYQGSRG